MFCVFRIPVARFASSGRFALIDYYSPDPDFFRADHLSPSCTVISIRLSKSSGLKSSRARCSASSAKSSALRCTLYFENTGDPAFGASVGFPGFLRPDGKRHRCWDRLCLCTSPYLGCRMCPSDKHFFQSRSASRLQSLVRLDTFATVAAISSFSLVGQLHGYSFVGTPSAPHDIKSQWSCTSLFDIQCPSCPMRVPPVHAAFATIFGSRPHFSTKAARIVSAMNCSKSFPDIRAVDLCCNIKIDISRATFTVVVLSVSVSITTP